MSTTANLDDDAIARAGIADPEHHGMSKHPAHGSMNVAEDEKKRESYIDTEYNSDNYPGRPTEEEQATLRRVSGKIKWSMWTIAFVELCERFSYYGSAVLYTNFVVQPLPPGSTTGAPLGGSGQPGALNLGQKAGQGISLFNQFFAYLMPLLG
jgi:POT family proton-dependent oligopeptide transporter